MIEDNFIKDHLWIAVMVILLFTAFVVYALNKNSDSEEEWEDNEEEEVNNEQNNDSYDENK